MRFLMGFITFFIIVLVLTRLPEHRKVIAFVALTVLVVAMGIVVWLVG